MRKPVYELADAGGEWQAIPDPPPRTLPTLQLRMLQALVLIIFALAIRRELAEHESFNYAVLAEELHDAHLIAQQIADESVGARVRYDDPPSELLRARATAAFDLRRNPKLKFVLDQIAYEKRAPLDGKERDILRRATVEIAAQRLQLGRINVKKTVMEALIDVGRSRVFREVMPHLEEVPDYDGLQARLVELQLFEEQLAQKLVRPREAIFEPLSQASMWEVRGAVAVDEARHEVWDKIRGFRRTLRRPLLDVEGQLIFRTALRIAAWSTQRGSKDTEPMSEVAAALRRLDRDHELRSWLHQDKSEFSYEEAENQLLKGRRTARRWADLQLQAEGRSYVDPDVETIRRVRRAVSADPFPVEAALNRVALGKGRVLPIDERWLLREAAIEVAAYQAERGARNPVADVSRAIESIANLAAVSERFEDSRAMPLKPFNPEAISLRLHPGFDSTDANYARIQLYEWVQSIDSPADASLVRKAVDVGVTTYRRANATLRRVMSRLDRDDHRRLQAIDRLAEVTEANGIPVEAVRESLRQEFMEVHRQARALYQAPTQQDAWWAMLRVAATYGVEPHELLPKLRRRPLERIGRSR